MSYSYDPETERLIASFRAGDVLFACEAGGVVWPDDDMGGLPAPELGSLDSGDACIFISRGAGPFVLILSDRYFGYIGGGWLCND